MCLFSSQLSLMFSTKQENEIVYICSKIIIIIIIILDKCSFVKKSFEIYMHTYTAYSNKKYFINCLLTMD